jgi:hypothetical protein
VCSTVFLLQDWCEIVNTMDFEGVRLSGQETPTLNILLGIDYLLFPSRAPYPACGFRTAKDHC